MKTLTVTQLAELNDVNVWEGGENKRIYLNDGIYELIGLEIKRYKSGSVSSAKLDGEDISNSKAKKIIAACHGAYYDCNTEELVCEESIKSMMTVEIVEDQEEVEETETETETVNNGDHVYYENKEGKLEKVRVTISSEKIYLENNDILNKKLERIGNNFFNIESQSERIYHIETTEIKSKFDAQSSLDDNEELMAAIFGKRA